MTNATTAGIGENHEREGGKDYTDNQTQSENMIVFGIWHG